MQAERRSNRDERDDALAGKKLWKERHDAARAELRLAEAVVDAAEEVAEKWGEDFHEARRFPLVAALLALREAQSDDDD